MTANTILPNALVIQDHGQEYTRIIEGAMEAVEQKMLSVVNSDVSVLRDASRHILRAGGKRIRPRLVILSYLATGGKDIARIVPAAAALELVHTASVVHDDINDHGVTRRGRPSVNSIWGRTFALLAGDFLFTKVYELMAPYKDLNVILAEATTALVEGETLQASAVKDNDLSRELYFEIIARKTAALFKSGAVLGGKLGNATEAMIEALQHFGYNIGLAFQIVDDILDLTADEHTLGKTAGIDIEQGKGFASIKQDDVIDKVKRKLLEGDRINEARTQADNLRKLAISALDVLPDTPYRAELIDLADLAVRRDH